MITRRPSILKSLQGLKQMSTRPESYIGVEQLYRKQAAAPALPTVASEGHLRCDGEPHQALERGLLESPRRHGHRRCRTEAVPVPDRVASTHAARHFKKAMVSFEHAYLALDTNDYAIEAREVQQLVVTHRRDHRRVRSAF
mmetsp:Transcript_90311/g.255704  ORF Transcript_90311/g.255704 Transcript_90311/m.255704 type:complete len:141 (-) Transcript_90311:112-534(-)